MVKEDDHAAFALRDCITYCSTARKFDGITIRDVLHWLPIQQRIQYKLCTLVFSCLHGVAPMCQPVSENVGRRCLRSAARGDLAVPASRTVHYGPCGFAVVGPSNTDSTLVTVTFLLERANITLLLRI